MATAPGPIPTGPWRSFVGGRINHRNGSRRIIGVRGGPTVRDIDAVPIPGDGDPVREPPTGIVATIARGLAAVSITETELE